MGFSAFGSSRRTPSARSSSGRGTLPGRKPGTFVRRARWRTDSSIWRRTRSAGNSTSRTTDERSAGRVVTFICPVSASIIGSTEYRGVGRFLRFVAFFAVLVAAFVLIALPLLLGPLLTQMVRNAGVQADMLSVSVAPFDPTLLLGHARKITLIASGVEESPARIGSVNLSIGDASYFDRSFETVTGSIDDVTVTVNDAPVHIGDVTVDGPADAANATAQLSASDTDRLIRLAGQRAGLTIDEVHVGDSGVTVKVSGIESNAKLAVSGGALVLDPGVGGAIVLLQPAPSDPWQLKEAWVDADGLNVRAVVDMTQLIDRVDKLS